MHYGQGLLFIIYRHILLPSRIERDILQTVGDIKKALELALIERYQFLGCVARDLWINPHPWIFTRTRRPQLLVENLRIGWIIHRWGGPIIWEGATKATERWNKPLGVFESAEHKLWIDPWMGSYIDKGRTLWVARNRLIISERVMCFVKSCLSDESTCYFCSYFLFFSSSPHPWTGSPPAYEICILR